MWAMADARELPERQQSVRRSGPYLTGAEAEKVGCGRRRVGREGERAVEGVRWQAGGRQGQQRQWWR